jgi:hypothetical protein
MKNIMFKPCFYSKKANSVKLFYHFHCKNILNSIISSNCCLKPNFFSTLFLIICLPSIYNIFRYNSPNQNARKAQQRRFLNIQQESDQNPKEGTQWTPSISIPTHTQNKPPPKSLIESPENSDDDEYQSKLYLSLEVD